MRFFKPKPTGKPDDPFKEKDGTLVEPNAFEELVFNLVLRFKMYDAQISMLSDPLSSGLSGRLDYFYRTYLDRKDDIKLIGCTSLVKRSSCDLIKVESEPLWKRMLTAESDVKYDGIVFTGLWTAVSFVCGTIIMSAAVNSLVGMSAWITIPALFLCAALSVAAWPIAWSIAFSVMFFADRYWPKSDKQFPAGKKNKKQKQVIGGDEVQKPANGSKEQKQLLILDFVAEKPVSGNVEIPTAVSEVRLPGCGKDTSDMFRRDMFRRLSAQSMIAAAKEGNLVKVENQLNSISCATMVDINALDCDGMSAMHYAAENVNTWMLKALIDAGADVNVRTKREGNTPLMLAALNLDLMSVRLLLKAGADANAKNADDKTALVLVLNYASEKGFDYRFENVLLIDDIKQILVKAMCSAPQPYTQPNDIRDYSVKTAGYSVQTADNSVKLTPMKTARDSNSVNNPVNHFLPKLARIPKTQKPAAPEPKPDYLNHPIPLIAAADCGDVEKVRELLADPKTKINDKDSLGYTALTWAVGRGHIEIVKLLAAANAEVDMKNFGAWSALHEATAYGSTECMKLLLDPDADAGAKTDNGKTASEIVADIKRANCIKVLEEYAEMKAQAVKKAQPKSDKPAERPEYKNNFNMYEVSEPKNINGSLFNDQSIYFDESIYTKE